MRWLVLCVTAVMLTHADSISENSAALELTTAGFEETVRTNDLVLVDFFAPWCGFCTRLAPEWSLLARELKGRATVATLDCDAHQEWCKRTWKITSFPTIYAFAYGKKVAQYDSSEYKLHSLVRWAEKLMASDAYAGPAPVELEGEEAMDEWLLAEPSKAKVVGFFFSRSIPDALEFALLCANKELQKKVVFGLTRDPELFERYSIPEFGVGMFGASGAGRSRQIYTGDFKAAALEEWVTVNTLPLIEEFGPKSSSAGSRTNLPFVIAWYSATDESRAAVHTLLGEVAMQYRQNFLFLLADSSKYSSLYKSYKPTAVPTIVINSRQKGRFRMDAPLDATSLREFLDGFQQGSLNGIS